MLEATWQGYAYSFTKIRGTHLWREKEREEKPGALTFFVSKQEIYRKHFPSSFRAKADKGSCRVRIVCRKQEPDSIRTKDAISIISQQCERFTPGK